MAAHLAFAYSTYAMGRPLLLVWQYLHKYQYFVEQLPSNASFCSVCGVKMLH